jgi:hypothetical protein
MKPLFAKRDQMDGGHSILEVPWIACAPPQVFAKRLICRAWQIASDNANAFSSKVLHDLASSSACSVKNASFATDYQPIAKFH